MTHTTREITPTHGSIENPSLRAEQVLRAAAFLGQTFRGSISQLSLAASLVVGTTACKNLGSVETNDELVEAGFRVRACEFTKKNGDKVAYYKFGKEAACMTRAKIIFMHGIDQDGVAAAALANHLPTRMQEKFASVDTVAHGKTPLPSYLRPRDMNPVTASNFDEEFIHDQFDGQNNTLLICHSAGASKCLKMLPNLPNTHAILINPALPIKQDGHWSNKNIRIPSRWVATDCRTPFVPGVIHKGATAALKEGWNNGPELIEMSLSRAIIEQANKSNRSVEIIQGNTTQNYPIDPNKNTPVERVRADLKINCKAMNHYVESIRTIRFIKEWGQDILDALQKVSERVTVILDPSDAVTNVYVTKDFLLTEFGIQSQLVELRGGHSVHLTNPQGLVKAMFPRYERKNSKEKEDEIKSLHKKMPAKPKYEKIPLAQR